MHSLARIAAQLAVLAVLVLPSSALAIGVIPIGGKVVGIINCPPPLHGYEFIVAGLSLVGSGAFWYLPGASITFPHGPPIVGEWVLGLASPGGACGPARSIMQGTSLPVPLGGGTTGASAVLNAHGLY